MVLSYNAELFNPRNGTYTMIDKGWMPTKDGLWNVSTQSMSHNDWVLKIQRVNDSNSSSNLAFGMNTRSSSNWNMNQVSNEAVDDDLSTN
jgi:hypothetical protein